MPGLPQEQHDGAQQERDLQAAHETGKDQMVLDDITGSDDLRCAMLYTDVIFNLSAEKVSWCCKQDPAFRLSDYQPSLYHSTPLLAEIRDSLAAEVKHSACYRCWNAEAIGVRSFRQMFGSMPGDLDPRRVARIEIKPDKICDLACVYCGPWCSTTWQAENSDSRVYPDFAKSASDPNLGKVMDAVREISRYNKSVMFEFTGGEPFLSRSVNEAVIRGFVDAFKENAGDDAKITLKFTTNANTPPAIMDEAVGFLGRIKDSSPTVDITISVSMESTGSYFEMSRYHASWDRVDRNLNTWLKQRWANVEISSTFNSFTLPDLPNFVVYIAGTFSNHDRIVKIAPNVAYDPPGMSTTILPESFSVYIDSALAKLQEIGDCFGNDRHAMEKMLVNIGKTLGTAIGDKPALRRMVDYVSSYRGVDIRSINPHLCSYVYDQHEPHI